MDENRAEASLACGQRGAGVASVERPAGGRSGADRDNEGASDGERLRRKSRPELGEV